MPLRTINGELVETEPGYWANVPKDRAEELGRKHAFEPYWDGFDDDCDFEETEEPEDEYVEMP